MSSPKRHQRKKVPDIIKDLGRTTAKAIKEELSLRGHKNTLSPVEISKIAKSHDNIKVEQKNHSNFYIWRGKTR